MALHLADFASQSGSFAGRQNQNVHHTVLPHEDPTDFGDWLCRTGEWRGVPITPLHRQHPFELTMDGRCTTTRHWSSRKPNLNNRSNATRSVATGLLQGCTDSMTWQAAGHFDPPPGVYATPRQLGSQGQWARHNNKCIPNQVRMISVMNIPAQVSK